ncbi:MAG: aminoglycoside phosphotransferase family protein [Kibdelosporangium sp.]
MEITAELVGRLVAAQFPQWARLPVASVARPGVDNATFRLGDDKLVRLPAFERWIGQVEREQRWLPRLGPLLPLAVPVPLGEGEPGEGYPFPWSIYEWLPGDRADIDELADPHRTAIELAEFLLALQAIDASAGPPPEWSNGFRGVDLADRRDSPVVESRMRARIAQLEAPALRDGATAVWEAALEAPVWDRPPVWIHGDPCTGNILAEDGRLSAVIDFGTLAVGDPACDLIAAWGFLNAGTRHLFRDKLQVDDATWARGRGWGLTSVLHSPTALAELIADHELVG